MYQHQGQGFAINRSAKKCWRDRLKGGLTRAVVKIRKLQIEGLCQTFFVVHRLGFQCTLYVTQIDD